MVKAYYQGRLGNQMFIYAMSRIIAERKRYRLIAEPIQGFDGTKEQIHGDIILNNAYLTSNYHEQYLDWETILKHKGAIICNGFYQHYPLFVSNSNRIKEWFDMGTPNYQTPNPNDLVIHARLGDYLRINKNYLGFDFYYNMFKTISHDKAYVLTDSPEHPDMLKLKSEGCEIISNGTLEDFYFLKSANKLVISHSTYSWWAAFLSNANEIYFPLKATKESRGIYSDFEHNDMRISDNNKIKYIFI